MHICFVSRGIAGGAGASMIDLVDVLLAEGARVSMICAIDDWVAREMRQRNVPVRILHFESWTHKHAPPPAWQCWTKRVGAHLLRGSAVGRELKQLRPDVVVTNTLTICEGAIGARLASIPHVTHVREFGDRDHGLQFEYGAQRSMSILNSLSSKIVFISHALAKAYNEQVPDARAAVVYNTPRVPQESIAAADVWQRPADQPFTCAIVGGISEGKRQHEAIAAVKHLRDEGIEVTLNVVGKGGQANVQRLADQVRRDGLGDRVTLVGHSDRPYEYMIESDVVLVCSRCEAFGRVTVEAMKVRRPVIGSNAGGTPELIDDQRTGLLYEAGNVPDLAEKIRWMLEHPQKRVAMGERAANIARAKFTLQRYGHDVLTVLNEVVPEEKRMMAP
jgi:glycosyltransferase involved in cell wall biosynthesis